MAVNIGGLISVIFFYLAILISGLWAAWYGRKSKTEAVRKDEEGDDAPENEVSKKPRSNSILVLGIQGKIKSTRQEVEAMLAGRNIGWVVGSFTMTGKPSFRPFLMRLIFLFFNRRAGCVSLARILVW